MADNGSLPTRCDVVIIGGGIWGAATAFYLRRSHGLSVTLIERQAFSAATTSRAAALMPRARTHPTLRAMVRETYTAIDRLEALLEEPLGLRRVGALHVAVGAESKASLTAQVMAARQEGDQVDHPSADQIKAMVPWMTPGQDWDYALFPEDGFIDPYVLGYAYARAAKKAGAVLAQSQEVVGLLGDGKSHVEGVRLSDGHTITADMTVCAAGPWSALVGQWVGLGLPLAPVRSHYWISAMDDRFARNQVMVFIPDGKFYSRPELGGLLYGFRDRVCVAADPRLYPPDPAGFAFGYDDEGWDSLAEGIAGFTDYFPGLDQVPTAHYISAASAYTPDGKFVIGAWPTVKGFLAVTGCSGAGIATSGGVGRAAAAMAAGSTAPYDMSLFRPDRFGPIDPVDPAFLQRCADARANKRAG